MKTIFKYILLINVLVSALCADVSAQPTFYNFHKLGFQEGLHDGIIRCINQDKFGYIWVGSVGAVNRYNGKSFKKYTHIPEDTLSPYGTQPRIMHSDKKGRFWIGFENGLMEYDFAREKFIPNKHFKNNFVRSICSINEEILFVGTNKGLYKYDVINDTIFYYGNSKNEIHKVLNSNRIYDIKNKHGKLFLGTDIGIVYLNLENDEAITESNEQLKNLPIISLAIDKDKNIWICSFGKIKLAKLRSYDKKLEIYDSVLNIGNYAQPFHIAACVIDIKNRLWVATTQIGLMQYDEDKNTFIKYTNNVNIPSSPIGNSYRCMFQDASGLIWLGYDVEGVNYFNPDKNLFSTVLPFPENSTYNKVGRAVTQDKDGNIWLGNHDGVSKYNPKTNTYQIFRNESNKKEILYSNHVRSLLCDDDNNIWIGTSSGVNKYNSSKKTMEYIDKTNLPLSFYNSINRDNSGNIWFCTNDSAALYWHSTIDKTYHNISTHPQLKKYKGFASTSFLLDDSKNRLWISYGRKGAVMFDKNTLELKHFEATDTTSAGLIGNQIIDIKEDRKGIVWLSTFNGITGIDVNKNIFKSYNNKNGLSGNMSGPIAIDNKDRIWAGVNGGLAMIENDRKSVHLFTEADGLSSTGFPEHAGFQSYAGDIMFPSNIGIVIFNPNNYEVEKTDFEFYISEYKILDMEPLYFNEEEKIPTLNLNHNENSFSFGFVALNYNNPDNTKFAYHLEGFDKTWHYTTEPFAIYTNIPGGSYKFYLKASDNNNNWDNIDAKQVTINLQTIFYKTTWFKILAILFAAFLIYLLYRYRSKQQKQLFKLKNKAQSLEKEKAIAMFENLKQQLNPHFLFNSLTSLSGLIELDKNTASNFLNQMSVIYRYILKNADAETVTLKEEMDFVKMYINIQKTRFNEGFIVNVNVPPEYHHYKIAPVTLQNLIENAIKHNIIDKRRPLVIDIFVDDHYLVVRNNLQKKTVVETSNQKGLKQFITLYEYLSDSPVIIDDSDESVFQIKIPLI